MIIPAIDILGGKVVRVKQGREETAKSYSNDPNAIAKDFFNCGATIVHVVDLDAAIRGDVVKNIDTIKEIISNFADRKLMIEIAGGMRDEERPKELLGLGAARAVLGSIAYDDIKKARSILKMAGSDRIVLALDYDRDGFVRIHGWKKREAESLEKAFKRFNSEGFTQFLATSVEQDGMLGGPDLSTLRKLRSEFPPGDVRILASGGVSSESDLEALSRIGIDETIVGRAFYEGAIRKSILSRVN